MVESAGILLHAKSTGRNFFVRRSDSGLWSVPGGHVERGESASTAALRELNEETGFEGEISLSRHTRLLGGFFRLHFGEVAREFRPRLDREHTDYMWTNWYSAPEPLHPGLVGIRGS